MQLQPVLIPTNVVAMYYNCHYMPAICHNSNQWLLSPRGQSRALSAFLPQAPNSHIFGFDMNRQAKEDRGNSMCPRNWRNNHVCPEPNQPNVMPGPWYTTALETGDPMHDNEIMGEYNLPDPNNPGQFLLSRRSGRYYTCEEWPPRRWVSVWSCLGLLSIC